jgi:GAF domain-containing protein/HAMP domain-containing protein
VDVQGRVIAHRDPSVVLRGTHFAVPDQDGIHAGLDGSQVVLATERIQLGEQVLDVVAEKMVPEALNLAFTTIAITAGLSVVALIVAGSLGILAMRRIVRPVEILADTAQAVAAGDLSRQAEVIHQDEIGHLAQAFNSMTARLCNLVGGLEQEIAERKRVEEALAHHAQEMAALYATSIEINSQPDVLTLLRTIVRRAADLLGTHMGGLYLSRPDGETLELVVNHNLPSDRTGAILRLGEGLSGRVAQTMETMVVENYSRWEGRAIVYDDIPFRRVLGVPLKVGDKLIGVLNVNDDVTIGPFSEDEIRLVKLFADQAAIAVENARLYQAERKQRELAERLREAALALTTSLDRDQVIERILAQLQQVVPYDSASVQLLRNDHLEIVGGRGFPNLPELLNLSFPVGGSNPNSEVVRSRAPFIVEDAPTVYEDFRREPHAQAGIRAWVGVPMLVGERLMGMLTLDRREPGFYTQEHARLAQAFAAQAAIAIENARLFESERAQLRLARTLQEVGALLTTRMSLNEVFERIFDLLAQVVEYDSVSVQLLNEEGSADLVAGCGFPDLEQARRVARIVARQTLQKRFREHKVVVIPDTYTDSRWIPGMGQEYIRSWIGAALLVKGTLIGALNVDSATVKAYDEATGETVAAFANQAAVAIENARMFTEREALIAELETKNAELAQFNITVFHDLKNPLTTIGMFAGSLEYDMRMGNVERTMSDVARIRNAAEKMNRLLVELLEFSRIGCLMNPPEEVSFGDLAREAVSMAGDQLTDRGIVVNIAPDLPMFCGDRARLLEMLQNVVDNAVKYMGDQPHPRVEIGVRQDGDEMVFYVRDNGMGIDPRYHQKIFGLFEKLDAQSEGTGMGLAIVKRIVEVHGGRIWVESEGEGFGSTFCFTLPDSRSSTAREAD